MSDTDIAVTLELTQQEQAALLTLIDMAVKAHGLSVASAAFALAIKVKPPAEAAAVRGSAGTKETQP